MTIDSTDESLMAAVREGEYSDLQILFERHHRTLYEFFYRMTGDRAVSEDLVQDVFSRILQYRDTFRDDSRFNSWLYRMARNVHHKIKKEDYELSRPVTTSAAAATPGSRTEALRSALLNLPEDRRELVVLSQYLQLTPDEIAGVLDVDVPAARVRVHRALMELRDVYRTLQELSV